MPQACAEEGCDRPAVVAGGRCVLHEARLGPLPPAPEPPRVEEQGLSVAASAPVVLAPERGNWRLTCGLSSACVLSLWGGLLLATQLHLYWSSDLMDLLTLCVGTAGLLVAPSLAILSFRAARRAPQVALSSLLLLVTLVPHAILLLAQL